MSLEEEARESLEAKHRAEAAAAAAALPEVRKALQIEALGGRGSELVMLLRRSGISPIRLSTYRRGRELLGDVSWGWVLSSAATYYPDENGPHWSGGIVIGTDGFLYGYGVGDQYSVLSPFRLRRMVGGVAPAELRYVIETAEAVLTGKFDHADRKEYRWLFAGRIATLGFYVVGAFGLVAVIACCIG